MLSPEEFSVGGIGDVTSNLALILPRGDYEYIMLVTRASGSPYAIFLTGPHQFAGFECSANGYWKGLIIPDVAIEIDESSVFGAEYERFALGAMVRKESHLEMVTRVDDAFHRMTQTPLIVDLPQCRQNMAAGFAKWRIVLGDGPSKRELTHIDISKKSAG